MIQNALDSVETRQRHEKEKYSPCINVIIDIKNSILTVSDNGIGFEENQYLKFLAPNFSFKSGNTRGHKGVGSTYLAYGFNYIQIATRSASFETVGKMENAKNWLSDENPSGNPRVVPDDAAPKDDEFMNFDRGVSISIRYDSSSYPSDLSWIKVSDAESWLKILRIKTGLGAIIPNNSILILVKVISKTGETTTASHNGIRFLHATEFIPKTISYSEIKNITDELYAKHGKDFRMPAKLENLDAIYDTWDAEILEKEVALDEAEKKIVETHSPRIEFIYVYSVKVWDKFNQSLGLRANLAALAGGMIRGMRIMSTNERFTYDGLFHPIILPPYENQQYDASVNPLGIAKENIEEIKNQYPDGIVFKPKVLEYKFSLDGLVEDINNGKKNSNDINLVIAWESGEEYKMSFYIKSLLLDENLPEREYHGVTHRMFDHTTNEHICDLILLKDLVEYLNDQETSVKNQQNYDE